MRFKDVVARWILPALVFVVLTSPPVNADPPSVRVEFDDAGLSAIRVDNHNDGQSILKEGRFRVNRVQLASEYRNKNELPYENTLNAGKKKNPYSGYEPEFSDGSTKPQQTTFNPDAHRLTRRYPWGTVGITYTAKGNGLTLKITVHNRSDKAIEFLSINPLLQLQLPAPVKGGGAHHNVGAPTVISVQYADGTVAVTNDGVKKPLRLKAATGKKTLKLVLRSGYPSGGKEIYDGEWVTRPIAPGKSDTYQISLRFGGPDASKIELGREVYDKYGEAFPRTLQWHDRRPIGTLFLSGGQHQSENNPFGWGFVPDDVDLSTKKGQKAFKKGLMKYADRVIGQMHAKGLQGVIVWDVEAATRGEPHYFGAPRYLPVLAPLMDKYADAFFKKLREAGLRTGICVRPKLHWPIDKNDKRVDEWNSEEQVDTRSRPWLTKEDVTHPQFKRLGIEAEEAESTFHRYDNKITYAKKRWGCTIFYLDTVYFWRPRDRSKEDKGWSAKQISAQVFRKLQKRHPDVLLIPEQQYPQFWAYTAPYHQLGYSPLSTTEEIRAIYPESFVAQMIANKPDQVKKKVDLFTKIVRNGDLFLTHGWWGGQQKIVRKVYRQSLGDSPMIVRLNAEGGIKFNDQKMQDLKQLHKAITAAVEGAELPERRIFVKYARGTSGAFRKKVFKLIGEAGGILAWSQPTQ